MKEEQVIPLLPASQARLRSNRLEEVLYPKHIIHRAWTSVCVLLFAHHVLLPQGMAADAPLAR